jgi:hypothetical protein
MTTPTTAAGRALLDEFPGVWFWEDPRWNGPLGEAIEAEARATHEHVYGRFGEDDPLSWTCGVCGLPKPAAPDPAPLDVERLAVVAAARALRERLTIDPGNVVSWGEWDTLDEALAKLGAKP